MNIIMTAKNVDYNADGAGYHFGAHFNSNAQVLSFNIDIMDPTKVDELIELFNEEFKPEIMSYVEEDIVIPEPAPQPEEEEEANPEDEVEPNSEEQGENE